MSHTTKATSTKKTAGAFDIRVIIGSLLGIYGLILTVMGIFGDPETDKTGGPNANLWAGLTLLLVAVLFLVWWRVRPIVVADAADDDHDDLAAPPRH